MQIKVSGGQFFVNGYPVRAGFGMAEGEERLVSYIGRRGAGCATLRMRDGRLETEGEIGRTDWRGGVELYPTEDAPASVQECDVEGEKVTVRFGRETQVGGFRYEPALPLIAPAARYLGGQRLPLIEITAGTTEGDYLAILSLYKGDEHVLLEVCGEVTTEENEVTVTRRVSDLRRRKITDVHRWTGADFERTAHRSESTYTGTLPRDSLGRILLEAVAAEDEEEVRAVTTAELSDMGALREYFGAIERVRKPLFHTSPTAVALQKKTPNGRVAITYDFSFEGNKIDNIFSVDE